MRKLLMIHGLEQSGKSTLAALVEKIGITFLPWQDDFLERTFKGVYASGDYGAMVRDYQALFASYSQVPFFGRTNLSRDDIHQSDIPPFDVTRVAEDIESLKTRSWTSFLEVWFECRAIAMRAMNYKEWKTDPNFQAIGPFHSYQYADAYKRMADQVYTVNIHRPFESWMNSRTRRYQYNYQLSKTPIDGLRSYHPAEMVAEYKAYERYLEKSSDLVVSFDDLFNGKEAEILKKIATLTGLPMTSVDLKKEFYEGQCLMVPHAKLFTPFDDRYDHMGYQLRHYLGKMHRKSRITRWNDTLARLLFLQRYYFGKVPFTF